MITAYYYSSNSGCSLSACCVPGILLMVLLFILSEDLLYMPAQGSSRHRRYNSEHNRQSLCFHDSCIW